jgi:outer membrane protein assembly factor BamB
MRFILGIILATICFSRAAIAADWCGYRGPNQDGISNETVNLNWPADGPKVVWKAETKNGFSSFAVVGDKAFTLVNRDLDGSPREICVALDAASGKEVWMADLAAGKGYSGGGDGDGPRSTPTISEGLVYTFTPDLVLHCHDAQTGKAVWTKDLIKEHAGHNIGWNSAASPVIDGDLVFVAGGGPGQSLLGIAKKTGKVVWKTGKETMTHAMPVVGTILDRRQVIFFCKSGLVAVAAKNGRELWRFPYNYKTATAVSPVICGDVVYCSAGYGVGGGACKITKSGTRFTATELYRNVKSIQDLWSTPVFKDGYLYGMISFKQFKKGPLKCVEAATGNIRWEQPGFGAGQVILVGDKLLALSDQGELVVVEATPNSYKEIARAKVVNGKCWSTPALSDGRIYVRSTTEAACLDAR